MRNFMAILANIALLPIAFVYDLARFVIGGKPEPKTLGGAKLA